MGNHRHSAVLVTWGKGCNDDLLPGSRLKWYASLEDGLPGLNVNGSFAHGDRWNVP